MILGFIHADGDAHGVYYVDWCEGPHETRSAYITVSLGVNGSDEAGGADRWAYCVETRCEGMRLCDTPVAARDSPDFLGRFVPRDEALQMDDIDHLWHVCDHLTDDRRFAAVAAWLCGDLSTALEVEDDDPPLSYTLS